MEVTIRVPCGKSAIATIHEMAEWGEEVELECRERWQTFCENAAERIINGGGDVTSSPLRSLELNIHFDDPSPDDMTLIKLRWQG
jgi:hypothetical protein